MLVAGLPADSNYMRELLGEYAGWDTDRYLAAATVDKLNVLIWQQTEDGHRAKPRNFPKPVWRPGQPLADEEDDADGGAEVQTFGAQGMTTADVDAYFAKVRGGGDVSLLSSAPRTSPSSRRPRVSKPTSQKNSRQPVRSPRPKDRKPGPRLAEGSEEA